MYEERRTVDLVSSASLLPNNVASLTVDDKVYAAVVHREEVNLVCTSCEGRQSLVVPARLASSAPPLTVMQVRWVQTRGRTVLVLATTQAALFYDWDGSVLLHSHLLPPAALDAPIACTRGIAALDNGCICVGVHTGEVVTAWVRQEEEGVEAGEAVSWLERPITAMAAQGLTLVAGDSGGVLCVGQAGDDDSLTKLHTVASHGWAVTVVVTWRDWLLAGYLSGHLRIFSLHQPRIIAEVCCHARGLMGLDVAQEGLMVTAAEDSFVKVWQLRPDHPDLPVEHRGSWTEENVALSGAALARHHGQLDLLTTGYDQKQLFSYRLSCTPSPQP